MILEKETYITFGYYSQDLKSKSNKKILAKCDECGIIREVKKYAYRKLCHSCSMRNEETRHKMKEAHYGKHFSKETKEKMRKTALEMSDETKQKLREAQLGKHHSEETKKKLCDAKQNMTKETKQKMSKNHADFKGDKSGMWKGGISFEPYCILFNIGFKERVREYWDRKCVVCRKTERTNGKKLSVHHVMYNKNTCCDGSLPLFVALCHSCHSKTNSDRKYWKNIFETIIYSKDISGKCYLTTEEWESFKNENRTKN